MSVFDAEEAQANNCPTCDDSKTSIYNPFNDILPAL
jgi:hypothetical protein